MIHQTAAVLAAEPAQAPIQAAPGVIPAGSSLIIILIVGFLLYRAVDKKKAKPVHLIMAFVMGALLSGSMLGVMAKQTSESVGTGVQTMLGTVVGPGGR